MLCCRNNELCTCPFVSRSSKGTEKRLLPPSLPSLNYTSNKHAKAHKKKNTTAAQHTVAADDLDCGEVSQSAEGIL